MDTSRTPFGVPQSVPPNLPAIRAHFHTRPSEYLGACHPTSQPSERTFTHALRSTSERATLTEAIGIDACHALRSTSERATQPANLRATQQSEHSTAISSRTLATTQPGIWCRFVE